MELTIDDLDNDFETNATNDNPDGEPSGNVKDWVNFNGDKYYNNLDLQGDDVYDNNDASTESSIIIDLLKSKNINPEAIKFVDDKGVTSEKHFNDLTREEQLEILNYDNERDDYNMEDDEINLINQIRNSKLSVNEYMQQVQNQAVNSYINNNSTDNTTRYSIDDLEDDELFLADLKTIDPELSEEDALQILESEKKNPKLYSYKINNLRNTYKAKEDAIKTAEQEEQTRKYEEAQKAFEQTIVEAIQDMDSIDLGEDDALVLSEDDANMLASFILDSDEAGVRYIAKALNDPKTLTQMAWFALKGQETLKTISDYYKQEIAKVSKESYNKGLNDAKSGKTNARVYINKNNKNSNSAVINTGNVSSNDITMDDLD